MPELPEVCYESPNFQHAVEGDHHGDHSECVYCGDEVEYVTGRWVTA